ncbi:MAG: four helix bundle protein [Bacteroidales bacterium]|nr:four helix bundle protein [Bacteroidales bacterium]
MFTVRIMDFVESLSDSRAIWIISDQVLRSSSSIGANYRAAIRSKSARDFLNKLKIVEEETDETLYWLEILEKRRIGSGTVLASLIQEAHELLAIFVTSIKTVKSNMILRNSKK